MLPYRSEIGLTFRVSGLPTPKGSMRVVPIRRADGSTAMRLVQDRRISDWVATVRTMAAQVFGPEPPWTGPVRMGLEFYFPRPKSHYRGGKPGPGRLRHDAPKSVTRRPDLDKLLRAVLDALTGVVIADDAQVAEIRTLKEYADEDGSPGVLISIWRRPK